MDLQLVPQRGKIKPCLAKCVSTATYRTEASKSQPLPLRGRCPCLRNMLPYSTSESSRNEGAGELLLERAVVSLPCCRMMEDTRLKKMQQAESHAHLRLNGQRHLNTALEPIRMSRDTSKQDSHSQPNPLLTPLGKACQRV